MLTSLVVWIAFAVVNGQPYPVVFPSAESCQSAVNEARNSAVAASDCVRIELPVPYTGKT